LPRALASLATADPDRPVAVCRELTKRFEEVVRGSASELARRFASEPKGEITLVIGVRGGVVQAPAGASFEPISEAVAELVAAGVGRRHAARIVARLTGEPANRLYRASL
jgi:16S rRNA (cytidine1402-2'-O)-methyltransferase